MALESVDVYTAAVHSKDPFLFLGHGVGTSAKCLECYAWFAREPSLAAQRRIIARLPVPVASFANFDGALLHFGSDDDFEISVAFGFDTRLAHLDTEARALALGTQPNARAWRDFNHALDETAQAWHGKNQLVALLKPDTGEYGRKLSAWHRRSLKRAHELLARGAARAPASRLGWSGFAMTVCEEVLPEPEAVRSIATRRRPEWISGLAPLIVSGARAHRAAFAERASWLLASLPDKARERVRAELPGAVHKAIHRVPSVEREPQGVRRPKPTSPGPNAKRVVQSAVSRLVAPRLRQLGFEGSCPGFRRITRERTHLVWLHVRDDPYGYASWELATIAPRNDATLAQDASRAIDIRNRQRSSLVPMGFDEARSQWGRHWPEELAKALLASFENQAEPWLKSPARRRR